ncbi:MAG: ATP-binding cassette domain-containing protein [Lachnospiraceae bacterium]|nr:ATP-binding cassette domain-containing protein [Lachnospiraceae bacterium]
MLSLICGLLTPSEGEITLNNLPLKKAGANIGYMLQKDHLFEWRTVYSNVTLGLEIQHRLTPKTRENVDIMLETYGLSGFRDSRPSQLSGGMRQRAALIRTLALEPDLLLLDEPFSALDYQTRLSVCDDIAGIIKKEQKTAILVTHDLSEAISMADEILVLSRRPGRIRKQVPIHFAMEERTPMGCRNAPEFKDYFNLIWKELNTNA